MQHYVTNTAFIMVPDRSSSIRSNLLSRYIRELKEGASNKRTMQNGTVQSCIIHYVMGTNRSYRFTIIHKACRCHVKVHLMHFGALSHFTTLVYGVNALQYTTD